MPHGIAKSLLTFSYCIFIYLCLYRSTNLIYRFVFSFLDRRKSKARRSKSRYKMLEADEQDTLELQPPRAGKNPQPRKPVLASTHFNWFSVDVVSSYVTSLQASAILMI